MGSRPTASGRSRSAPQVRGALQRMAEKEPRRSRCAQAQGARGGRSHRGRSRGYSLSFQVHTRPEAEHPNLGPQVPEGGSKLPHSLGPTRRHLALRGMSSPPSSMHTIQCLSFPSAQLELGGPQHI